MIMIIIIIMILHHHHDVRNMNIGCYDHHDVYDDQDDHDPGVQI